MVHSGATRGFWILAVALSVSCGGRATKQGDDTGAGGSSSGSGGNGAGSNPSNAGAGAGGVAGAAGQGGSQAG